MKNPWEDSNTRGKDIGDHEQLPHDKGSDTLTVKAPNYSEDNWGATLPQVQEGEEKMTSATSMTTPYCECGQCSSAEEDNAKTEEFRKKTADLKQSNAELVERARSLQSQLKHIVKVYQEHSPQGDQHQVVPKDLPIPHEEPQDEPSEGEVSQEVEHLDHAEMHEDKTPMNDARRQETGGHNNKDKSDDEELRDLEDTLDFRKYRIVPDWWKKNRETLEAEAQSGKEHHYGDND